MTSPTSLPTPKRPFARPRRVKRGIVAGYIHDISPRHRPSAPGRVAVAAPVTAAPSAR
ncbi:MAG TPA: hypothetical protein VNT03_00580 [Baekduia sp.]|nr:hypothetical protein [Baekduia sp.]